MLDEILRDLKERILIPFAKQLAIFASPNTITVLGFLFGVLLCDGVDGVVARITNQQSDLGAYLDIGFDFTIYAAIPIAIAASRLEAPHLMLLVAIMEATYFVNAGLLFHAAALCEKRALSQKARKTSTVMTPGLIEGFETMVFYGLFLALPQYTTVLFASFAALVFFTILQRVFWGIKTLR